MTITANQKRIAVALVQRGQDFLLVRRRSREGKLHWQFPSGEINADEAPSAAAEREVMEETGVACHAAAYLGDRTHPDTGVHISYHHCTYVSGEARVLDDEELDSVEWMKGADALGAITSSVYPAVERILLSSP